MKKFILFLFIAAISFGKVEGQHEYLVKVNPATGAFTKFDSIPGDYWISVAPNYTNLVEANNAFLFKGSVQDFSVTYLYSLNLSDGKIISQPVMANNNLMHNFLYGSASNILYGILDNSSTVSLLSVNASTASIL